MICLSLCASFTSKIVDFFRNPTFRIYSTAIEFQNFLALFQTIYHNSSFISDTPEASDIITVRQAEIIVYGQIDLTALKKIVCRSKAEYDTLHYLLGTKAWDAWQDIITIDEQKQYFFHGRPYIKSVSIEKSIVHITMNENGQNGRFTFGTDVIGTRYGNIIDKAPQLQFTGREPIQVTLDPTMPLGFSVRFLIDGNLAYENSYWNFVISQNRENLKALAAELVPV